MAVNWRNTIQIDYNTVLGSGGYAVVYKGWLIEGEQVGNSNKRLRVGSFNHAYNVQEIPTNHRRTEIAIKRLQLLQVNCHDREGSALGMLSHRNVVKLLHVESDDNFRYYGLELCLGSLDQLFLPDGHKHKYTGPTIPSQIDVLLELALGLEYIHLRQLAHRDIKPDNVLIGLEPDEQGTGHKVVMKWADFGLSKPVNERGTFSMSVIRGSMYWMAPELLNGLLFEEPTNSADENLQRGNIKSDVFATGCVFVYYLLGGKHPYGSKQVDVLNNIITNVIVEQPPLPFIFRMLDSNPETRIQSSEVVNVLQSMKH